jgi:hypothetical protein
LESHYIFWNSDFRNRLGRSYAYHYLPNPGVEVHADNKVSDMIQSGFYLFRYPKLWLIYMSEWVGYL